MDQTKMTMRVAADARQALEQWAEENLSTMTAELNRSIRLRAAQEHWERAEGASQSR